MKSSYLLIFIESWGPTSQGDHTPREENWADFSKSFDGALSADEEEFEYRRYLV